MSLVQSGTKARLRFNHRGGADGARQLLGVVIEERIPGQVGVNIRLDQPTVLPQTDDLIRNGPPFTEPPVTFVIESAPRPLVTSIGGVAFRKRIRTLSTGGGSGSGGPLLPAQVEPAWAPVGISSLTVIAFGSGAGDTVSVTPLGGAAIVITEGVDFAAAVDEATTAENIRLALLAVGIVAIRTGAVLSIAMPLDAIVSGDVTAWTVALSATILNPIPVDGLIPKGRYNGHVVAWPVDPNGTVPNAGYQPAGELLRVRWTGTPELGETVDAGGNTGFSATLAFPNVVPGSVVILATVGGNVITIRDDGAGRLVGQESTANEVADGTIDYLSGDIVLAFTAATAGNVDADYEHSCLYRPLDINLAWDAQLAQG